MKFIAFCSILIVFFVACVKSADPKDDLQCNFGYMSHNGWCYKKVSSPETYQQALDYCRLEDDSDLVSIHSETENSFVKSYASSPLYIGLEYVGNETFEWSDNSTFDYQNLGDGFEEYADYLGDCAVMDETGKWNNAECDIDSYDFVCKRAPSVNPNTRCPATSPLLVDGGQLTNPGYPEPSYFLYQETCSYKLAAKNGHLIHIVFDHIELSSSGKIYIYEGLTPDDNHLLKGIDHNSASGITNTVISTLVSNRMLIQFTSESSRPEKWRASWSSSAKPAILDETALERTMEEEQKIAASE